MRDYPKGYHAALVLDGHVMAEVKVTLPSTIRNAWCTLICRYPEAAPPYEGQHHVVVRPRGRCHWWVFRASWSTAPELVAKTPSRDAALMIAALDG